MDFEKLICYEIMDVVKTSEYLFDWCNHFIHSHSTEDFVFSKEKVLEKLFEDLKASSFFTWIKECQKLNLLENCPEKLLMLFLEIEATLASLLTQETQEATAEDYMILENLFWDNLSIESLFQHLETNLTSYFLQTSFTKSLFRVFLAWLKEFELNMAFQSQGKETKAQTDSSQSSGIPKKRKLDISTSITPVSTPKATVDAFFSKVNLIHNIEI